MRIDGSTWFVFALLVTGALFGALWHDHQLKQEQDRELREEQAMAVAVAEAHVIQHYYDRYHDGGQGAGV